MQKQYETSRCRALQTGKRKYDGDQNHRQSKRFRIHIAHYVKMLSCLFDIDLRKMVTHAVNWN